MTPAGEQKPIKYVIVTGGVISGVGKGIIASSTGVLLRGLGQRVSAIKIDPYLNIDAGTLSPYDHGEVFILEDGGEVDLGLGNYERFLNVTLRRDNNITTGKIYQQVIERERRGDYLGKTVMVMPHITDAIQDWIERVSAIPVEDYSLGTISSIPNTPSDTSNSNNNNSASERPDVCIIELGGTVGDIEAAPFVEALRQFQFRAGLENFMVIHVSLVPMVGAAGEQKTKPTQHTVRDLRGLGLIPDVVACRSASPLEECIKEKLAMFCHVPTSQVLGVHDCASVYHVPGLLHEQGLTDLLCRRLGIVPREEGQVYFQQWQRLAKTLVDSTKQKTSVAIVGKYTHLPDSYISVIKAINHAAMHCCLDVQINWIEASDLEEGDSRSLSGSDQALPTSAGSESSSSLTGKSPNQQQKYQQAWKRLQASNCIIVPGGFGERGTEGMIAAIKYAREGGIPLLGLCLGFQLSVVEHARNVLGWAGANSEEFLSLPTNKGDDNDGSRRVVIFMPEVSKTHMGGTMRLGVRLTRFTEQGKKSQSRSLYEEIYKQTTLDGIWERHRHRYEVNPALVQGLESKGLCFVGRDESGQRMEILERQDHPFFIGVQFHPEMISRPIRPSPLFVGLLRASLTLTLSS